MTVTRWLVAAVADADRRGLPELKPLLQGLAASTAALRAADWNERADAVLQTPAGAAGDTLAGAAGDRPRETPAHTPASRQEPGQ